MHAAICRLALRPPLAVVVALALGGCPGPTPSEEAPLEPVLPTATPVPQPTPPPPPYVPNKRMEVGKMFNGMQVRTTLETEVGKAASVERMDPASYAVEFQVKVRVPHAHTALAELARLNDRIPTLLPGLSAMLETAKVSPAFDELYRLKCAALQASLPRLDNLLSRHNFFDCETILELQHPTTKRRALLIQSEMDVDTDGSDGDRVPEIEGASSTFQPSTSYRWPKKTAIPNPFSTRLEARLRQAEMDLAAPGLSAPRREELKAAQGRLRTEISDLKKFSFLVGSADPFIVIPGSMSSKARLGPFTPAVGDYCVVIFGDTLYPAIVGDIGPRNLMGEASLRMCRQLNPRAAPDNRPVSDLKVSYLVFPGTVELPFDAPDLAKWRARCEKLLGEIGGFGGELFTWADLTKPKLPPDFIGPPAPA